MNNINDLIKETTKGQIEIIEKMKNDINNLPFYKQLEKNKIYRLTYNDFSKEKKIIIKYLEAVTSSEILNKPQIRYIPLKKDLTEYEGRRGHIQRLPIRYIIDIELIK